MSTPPSDADPVAAKRYPALDWIKLVAILTAIELHSGFGTWSPHFTDLDRLLRTQWGKFLVPAFLMTSGFLYYRAHPIPLRVVGERLRRLLIPYAIASFVFMALGFAVVEGWQDVLFKLATGSTLGIFYYMYQAALCTPLIWPLSRMRREWVLLVGLLLYAFAVVQHIWVGIALTIDFFWVPRNPFNYFFAYFVTGWLAHAYLPELTRTVERARGLLIAACLVGIGLWVVLFDPSQENWIKGLVRATYALGIVGLISMATRHLEAPRFVRFVSDATLAIYMYHRLFQLPLIPYTADWHPLVRLFVVFGAGLAGSSALVVVGRRLLGTRSRLLLGA